MAQAQDKSVPAAPEQGADTGKSDAAARQQPPDSGAAGGDAPGGGTVGEVKTTDKPLAGVPPFGVVNAGGPEGHEKYVESDPHVFESRPGKLSGVESVGSGQPMTLDAAKAMRDRANAGIPEPPKVGPIANTTLLDTPGGYQVVPAGFTPDSLEEHNADLRAKLAVPQTAEETGANVRVVAGPGKE
jgi:hypothetical protein